MRAQEWGLLLLCCQLPGDGLRPLTAAQLRQLSLRVNASDRNAADPLAELGPQHLLRLGYDRAAAEHICALLGRERQLEQYLARAERRGIVPLTRLSPLYPRRLRQQLGLDCPAVLFAAGDIAQLQRRCVALVGSRALAEPGAVFARRIGALAARDGFALVSGNAAGADRTAQQACLQAGGGVIAFVADELSHHIPRQSQALMLSEGGYDLPFSTPRALRRNAFIHALGEKSFVAQCTLGSGGTWEGTTENLRRCWSPVFVCNDGSAAAQALQARGASPVDALQLDTLAQAEPDQQSLFDHTF